MQALMTRTPSFCWQSWCLEDSLLRLGQVPVSPHEPLGGFRTAGVQKWTQGFAVASLVNFATILVHEYDVEAVSS